MTPSIYLYISHILYVYMASNDILDNKTISTSITKKERDKIRDLVHDGLYMSLSDFVRQAVRDKLGEN